MKFGITKRALSIFGASMAAMSLLTLAACNNDKGGSATKAGATPYELASDLPEGSKAVSYTHLDVYKRQF